VQVPAPVWTTGVGALERVSALQAALTTYKDTASRYARWRYALVTATAALCLALGFVLGLYSGQLRQSGADLVATLGLAPAPRNADTAMAARRLLNRAAALALAR
jgi:hypothetical protein